MSDLWSMGRLVDILRFWRGKKPAEMRAAPCGPVGSVTGLDSLFGDNVGNLAGVQVSNETILGIPAVWTAADTTARVLASLPFCLYRRTENGSEPAENHPVFFCTAEEPYPNMTAYRFRYALFFRACFGDSFAVIGRNGVGRAVSFRLADLMPFEMSNGEWVYIENAGAGHAFRAWLPGDVLHVPGVSVNGWESKDVARVHRETFAVAIASTQYGSAFFGNGAHISGVIESPVPLSKEQIQRLREGWHAKYGSVRNTGSTAVLDEGKKYSKIGLTPEEAQMTDTRQFQVRDVARIFGMPLHLFQDLGDTTFNNVESLATQFVTLYLRSYCVKTEQEFALKTLTRDERTGRKYFFKFNMNALLRGDTKTRGIFYTQMFNIGAMNPNEIRELEDMNMRDGGDEFFTPLNMNGSNSDAASGDGTQDTAPPEATPGSAKTNM